MYVLTSTHGKEKFIFDYQDHNALDIVDDVADTLAQLMAGVYDSFTVRWQDDNVNP